MSEQELILALRQRREELNITYRDMAQRSGLPQSTISRLEKGHCRPTLATILRYCQVLGLRINLAEVPPALIGSDRLAG